MIFNLVSSGESTFIDFQSNADCTGKNVNKAKNKTVAQSLNTPCTQNENSLVGTQNNRRNKLKDLSHPDPRHTPLLSRLLAPGFSLGFSSNSSLPSTDGTNKHSSKLKPKNSLFRHSSKKNLKSSDLGKKFGSNFATTTVGNVAPKTCPVIRKSMKVKQDLERDDFKWVSFYIN